MLAWVAALAGLAPAVNAFTLGELRGVAIIGRSLDVSVRVQGGPTEDLDAACFVAEVFHADVRQAAPAVTVTATVAGEALVRVRSTALVDEPVVSLELRSRCGVATTRRYVLLADMAPVAVPLPLASLPPLPVAAPAAAPTAAASAVDAPSLSLPVVTGQRPTGTPVPANPVPEAPATLKTPKPPVNAVARAQQSAKPRLDRAAGKAVLKLDPLDLFSDRVAALEAPLRFESTADALQQARKVTDLENDLKLLRDQMAKTDAQMLDLKLQLQTAQQSPPGAAGWLYALLAAALAGLLALAWLLWQQRRQSASAWHDAPALAVAVAPAGPIDPVGLGPAAAPAPVPPTPAQAAEPAAVAAEPGPPALLDPQWYAVPASPKPAGVQEGLHSFSAEPILDIRQQAEFFVSLGQTDRALHILKQQIADSDEPSPFIYLDLLALFHSLGMKVEFREYRHTFNQHFSCAMPDFAAFHMEGRGLLDYPEVLGQLVQGWPSVKTLLLLNGWIFRNIQSATPVSFDLAAFRDLLMLHALAEEVAVDLPWDSAALPFEALANTADEADDTRPDPMPPVASPQAKPASAAAPPAAAQTAAVAPAAMAQTAQAQAAQVRLPATASETNLQSLDMDLSMFDTSGFDLDPVTPEQAPLLPAFDLPRARWPARDPG